MSEHEGGGARNDERLDEEDVEAHLSRGTIGAGLAAAALFAAPTAQSKPAPISPEPPVVLDERAPQQSTQPAKKAKAKKAKAKTAPSKASIPRGKRLPGTGE